MNKIDTSEFFPFLSDALSMFLSAGFNFYSAQLYVFDSEKSLMGGFEIQNDTGLSTKSREINSLPGSVITEIYEQTAGILKTWPGGKIGITLPAFPFIDQDSSVQILLPFLANNAVTGIALFRTKNDNFLDDTPQRLSQFQRILSNAVNFYFRAQKVKSLEQELESRNAEFETLRRNVLRLEEENAFLLGNFEAVSEPTVIIGSSPQIQAVNQLIANVAPSDSTVLILGETGTGKELLARALHNSSSRRNKVMISVNCAALPPNLIESELFGFERGVFTGARERHIGKFEMAMNGTIFLDEIGDMPLEAQVKVLRVIQEKEIERIGGKGAVKVNVRIIAATNRNLHKEVENGTFRSDLFYRLHVFPIVVPPLRERKDDIQMLTDHFISKFNRRAGKSVESISKKVHEDMLAYDWPGNVRELEYLVERAVLLAKGKTITHIDLPPVKKRIKKLSDDDKISTLEENERIHILFALKKSKGKIYGKGGAAELLGIHYSTLNSRIKKLGIRKVVKVRKHDA